MGVPVPISMRALLLMAIIVVGASAKPSYTPNEEKRLYNRRGWFDSVGKTFNQWGDTLSDTASNVGDTASDWGEGIGDSVSNWDDALIDTAGNVGDAVSGWGEAIGDSVGNWDDVIVDTAGNVGETVSDWGGKVADMAGDLKDAVVDSVQYQKRVAVVDTVSHQQRDRLYNRRGWFDSVGKAFNQLGDALSDTASKVGDTVSDWGEDIGVSDWDDAIVDTAGNVGETLSDWGGKVADAAVDLKDTVVDSVQHQKRALSRESPEIFDNSPEQFISIEQYDPYSIEDQSIEDILRPTRPKQLGQLHLNHGSLTKPNPFRQHALSVGDVSAEDLLRLQAAGQALSPQQASVLKNALSIGDVSAEDLLRLQAAGHPLSPQQNALLQRALSAGKGLISIEQPDPYSLEQFNSIEQYDQSIEDFLRLIGPNQSPLRELGREFIR